jgi:hypothetical protein
MTICTVSYLWTDLHMVASEDHASFVRSQGQWHDSLTLQNLSRFVDEDVSEGPL